jgi:hypothetical protein
MGDRAGFSLLTTICLILALPLIASCSIKTPEIKGIVLDEKTKEPVKEAWIACSVHVESSTLGGPTYNGYNVAPPHLRTDENGRFLIPAKGFGSLQGFLTKVEAFGANANTMDGRGGGIDLIKYLKSKKTQITIYIKRNVEKEGDTFSYLQALSKYCETGRFSIEVPDKGVTCDKWELDYAIARHELFLREHPDPKTIDGNTWHTGALKQLAYLHQQRGNYRQALETFTEAYEFDKRRNMDLYWKEYDARIKELRYMLK